MSLDHLYSKVIVTVEDVEAQIKPLLKPPLGQRYISFYQRNINPTGFFQGDIVRLADMVENGSRVSPEDYGIIVSNSCDTEPGRDDFISIMPLTLLDPPDTHQFPDVHAKSRYSSLFHDVTNYNNTRYFYVPPVPAIAGQSPWSGMFGAFSSALPISSQLMHTTLQGSPGFVLASLQQRAYYLFLLKLTVHYLRPDDRFVTSSGSSGVVRSSNNMSKAKNVIRTAAAELRKIFF